MSLGKPATDLTDEDLERELQVAHLHRHETFMDGSAHALATHGRRTGELEAEFLRRFPDRVHEAAEKADGPVAAALRL